MYVGNARMCGILMHVSRVLLLYTFHLQMLMSVMVPIHVHKPVLTMLAASFVDVTVVIG